MYWVLFWFAAPVIPTWDLSRDVPIDFKILRPKIEVKVINEDIINYIFRNWRWHQSGISGNTNPWLGFPGGILIKNPPTKAGDSTDMGLIPGLGRSPGVANSNVVQYFCLGNPMDRRAWQLHSMGSWRVGHDLVTEHRIPLLLFVTVDLTQHWQFLQQLGTTSKELLKYWKVMEKKEIN